MYNNLFCNGFDIFEITRWFKYINKQANKNNQQKLNQANEQEMKNSNDNNNKHQQ